MLATDIKNFGPLCHGTSSKFLEGILKDGLKPRNCTPDGSVCRFSTWGGRLTSEEDRVYLGVRGNDICERAAGEASKGTRGKQVVLEIDESKLDPDKLSYDEDYKAEDYDFKGRLLGRDRREAITRCKELEEKEQLHEGSIFYGVDFDDCVKRKFGPNWRLRLWTPLFLPGKYYYDKEKPRDSVVTTMRIEFYELMKEVMDFCEEHDIVELDKSLPQWANSAMGTGSFTYKGTVPPEAIVSYKEFVTDPEMKEIPYWKEVKL